MILRARRLPSAAQLQLEGVLLAGGLRALLLQLAHPAVGHGVARHSDFETDPLRRLWGTLRYIYVVAAGEDELVRRFARSVGAAHRRVASAGDEPIPYDARDPALQLWVAASIHDTALRIAEAVWGTLPSALADELLALNGRLALVLGLPAEEWPTTRAAFDDRFRAVRLRFDAETTPIVRALVDARATPRWVRLVMPAYLRTTLGTLPGLEPALGPLVPRGTPDLLPLARRLAPATRYLPRALRTLPARRMLASARRERGVEEAPAGAVGVVART